VKRDGVLSQGPKWQACSSQSDTGRDAEAGGTVHTPW
jgi:hypothetical protein